MSSKNVLFFVRRFPVLSQTFVLNQIKDLKNEGMEVQVLSVNRNDNENSISKDIFGDDETKNVVFILPEINGMKSYTYAFLGFVFCLAAKERHNLISLFWHFIKKKNLYLGKDLMCQTWFLRKKDITAENCVAHFGSNGVVMSYLIQAGLVKCRNLFTVFHGYEISRFDQLKLWKSLYGKMEGFLLPISEYWERQLISFGADPAKIKVLHMGVDINRFSYSERPIKHSISILSVARATEKKGLIYAIEAVLKCPIECEYTIIGDGSLLETLKQVASRHKNSHRIIFEGAKPSDFVKDSLTTTDLFLLPSVRDTNGDMEGIPVSLMEAMASGVIVLSTIHSGIPELISDGANGFLVPERDSDALVQKICEIKNLANLNEIRRAARSTIEEKFNANKLSKELIAILK